MENVLESYIYDFIQHTYYAIIHKQSSANVKVELRIIISNKHHTIRFSIANFSEEMIVWLSVIYTCILVYISMAIGKLLYSSGQYTNLCPVAFVEIA